VTQADLQLQALADPASAAVRLAAATPAGHFDELRDPQGALRPMWREFFEHVGAGAFADFDRRAALLARQVRDDGITYNVYSDQHGPTNQWSLDLLPFIVSREDWAQIEEGIVQRASLLSEIARRLRRAVPAQAGPAAGGAGIRQSRYLRPLHAARCR
jgi:hypothetical protein